MIVPIVLPCLTLSAGTYQARGLAFPGRHQGSLDLGEHPQREAEQDRLGLPTER
jgi:hypothetical protein